MSRKPKSATGREDSGSREGAARAGAPSGARRLSIWRRHKSVLKPWLVFVVTYGGLLAIFLSGPFTAVNRAFTTLTTQSTAWALRLLGANGHAEDTIVSSSLFSVKIVSECTAVFPIMIFIAAVAAYPSPWRKRALGIAAGIPILILVNLVRLVSLFYIGHSFPNAFERAHLLVWQSLIIFFTLLLWLVWATRIVPVREG